MTWPVSTDARDVPSGSDPVQELASQVVAIGIQDEPGVWILLDELLLLKLLRYALNQISLKKKILRAIVADSVPFWNFRYWVLRDRSIIFYLARNLTIRHYHFVFAKFFSPSFLTRSLSFMHILINYWNLSLVSHCKLLPIYILLPIIAFQTFP